MQPMVVRKQAQELILGMSRDPIFGPVILFGAGGVAVEVMDDTAIALPPLDDVLAGDLIERTRIGRLLAGFRDRKPADRAAIVAALNGLSQMIVDFPCIVAMDINPLLADADGRDRARRSHRDRSGDGRSERAQSRARDPALSGRVGEGRFAARDGTITSGRSSRRISRLYPEFLAKVSPEDIRLRFLAPRKSFPDEMLKRLTQLDYDRDMAFVALESRTGDACRDRPAVLRSRSRSGRISRCWCAPTCRAMASAGRCSSRSSTTPRRKASGGSKASCSARTTRMLEMCREFGFEITFDPDEPGLAVARLELG